MGPLAGRFHVYFVDQFQHLKSGGQYESVTKPTTTLQCKEPNQFVLLHLETKCNNKQNKMNSFMH